MRDPLIIDFDDSRSVASSVWQITEDWFDPESTYMALKSCGITNRSTFWSESQFLLEKLAVAIHVTYENFSAQANEICQALDLRMMAYHCTRSRNPQDFRDRGILPLNEEVLRSLISASTRVFPSFYLPTDDEDKIAREMVQEDTWKYRSSTGKGPYFFLSYQEARAQDNSFLKSGSEIYWSIIDLVIKYCSERNIALPTSDRNAWRDKLGMEMKPLVVHCQIPYSMLTNQVYYIFCLFRSFFDRFDPENESLECGAVDLNGNTLEPRFITRIEEVSLKWETAHITAG